MSDEWTNWDKTFWEELDKHVVEMLVEMLSVTSSWHSHPTIEYYSKLTRKQRKREKLFWSQVRRGVRPAIYPLVQLKEEHENQN